MDWCRAGIKPLSEPTMTKFTDTHMRHSVLMSYPDSKKNHRMDKLKHRKDTFVSDRYLIDVDPRVFGPDGDIKWKNFPRYWPFARGIHRWPVNSPHRERPVTRSFGVFFDLRLELTVE